MVGDKGLAVNCEGKNFFLISFRDSNSGITDPFDHYIDSPS